MADETLDYKQLDEMQANKEIQKCFDYLNKEYAKPTPPFDIVWRTARAHYDQAGETADAAQKERLAMRGVALAEEALKMDPSSPFGYKWTAITLSQAGDFKGTKEKIEDAKRIRELADKAIELKPGDTALLHLIGRWCFTFADMGWVTKKLASAIFASPPTSTYEEALSYFVLAEEAAPKGEPNNFPLNSLWTGRMYLKTNNKAKAKEMFQRAVDVQPKSEAGRKVQAEAQEELKKL